MGGGTKPDGGWWQDEKGESRQGGQPDAALLADAAAAPALAASRTSVASRFGINPFSLGAFVGAVLVWSDVFHLSYVTFIVATIPGTALGALGVGWAIRKGQRKWFAWTAFG